MKIIRSESISTEFAESLQKLAANKQTSDDIGLETPPNVWKNKYEILGLSVSIPQVGEKIIYRKLINDWLYHVVVRDPSKQKEPARLTGREPKNIRPKGIAVTSVTIGGLPMEQEPEDSESWILVSKKYTTLMGDVVITFENGAETSLRSPFKDHMPYY
jgi:hypothetical protein